MSFNIKELQKELKKDLQLRETQYEYYRNMLLKCEKIEFKKYKLKDVVSFIVGGDIPKDNFSKEKTKEYYIPIYSNGINENALYGYTNIPKITEDSVTVSARGTIGFAEYREDPYYPIVRLICMITNENIDTKYLKYLVENIEFSTPKQGIPQLTVPMIENLEIELPSLEIQKRTVYILDNFETVCRDLKIGLPAEIEKRQIQYEYYRNMLLTLSEAI